MSIALIWRVLLYTWFAFEVLLAVSTRTKRGQGKLGDRGSLQLLWLSIAFSITAAMWIGAANPHNFLAHKAWVPLLCLGLMVLGLVVRVVAVVSLGRAFSVNVAIRDEQKVKRDGLYALMRHPSYAGMLPLFLSVGLAQRNWISLAIMVVVPGAALLYRIHVEEIALREHFGQEYVDYSSQTKRLIPGIY